MLHEDDPTVYLKKKKAHPTWAFVMMNLLVFSRYQTYIKIFMNL